MEEMHYKDIFFPASEEWKCGGKSARNAEKLKPTRRCLALPSAFRSLPDSIKSTQRRGSAHKQALETGKGGRRRGAGGWRLEVEE